MTRCSIPNGTVIPSRGHYLCVNSVGYSLASYPAGNGTTATGDATYTTDIPDNAGIALFNNNTGGGSYILANRLDAVGSTVRGQHALQGRHGLSGADAFQHQLLLYAQAGWRLHRLGRGRELQHVSLDPDDAGPDHRRAAGHRQQRHRLHLRGHQRHQCRRGPAAGGAGTGEPLVTHFA